MWVCDEYPASSIGTNSHSICLTNAIHTHYSLNYKNFYIFSRIYTNFYTRLYMRDRLCLYLTCFLHSVEHPPLYLYSITVSNRIKSPSISIGEIHRYNKSPLPVYIRRRDERVVLDRNLHKISSTNGKYH